MDKRVRSWIDDLASPNPDVRSSALELLGGMGVQADEAFHGLVEELDTLWKWHATLDHGDRFSSGGDPAEEAEIAALSGRISALWQGFGEVVSAVPDIASDFLHRHPDVVKWLGRKAPTEFMLVLCDHKDDGIRDAGRKAAWWIGRTEVP